MIGQEKMHLQYTAKVLEILFHTQPLIYDIKGWQETTIMRVYAIFRKNPSYALDGLCHSVYEDTMTWIINELKRKLDEHR